MPHCKDIRGYSGPSDVLMVSDAADKLVGVAIRHSYDTPSHVKDVTSDYLFMEGWNGFSWEQIAEREKLHQHSVHVVSGATRTSEAVARSIVRRAQLGVRAPEAGPWFTFRWHDAALVLLTACALGLAFLKKPWIQRRRTWIHAVMVLYLGLLSSDLLAQSLLVSWVKHGIPWRTLPGLVLLAALAFAIPWSTGHPVYCTHICPHGHSQRWLMKLVPLRRRLKLGPDEKWSFTVFPGALLLLVLLVTFLGLPIDLSGIEPFDAWAIRGAGIATLLVAGASLLFAAFVPMGYCRYGCPTDFLLDLVRRDRAGFRRRDLWFLALLLLSAVLFFGYDTLKPWLLE
jgi:NosR/NirI family transcriptional regulator, nitrous oxide reductase regulator